MDPDFDPESAKRHRKRHQTKQYDLLSQNYDDQEQDFDESEF